MVVQQWGDGFLFKVDAATVKDRSEVATRESLLRIIEPISGYVTIDKYQEVRDGNKNIVAYKVWVHR